MMFATERLSLRAFRISDSDNMVELWNDPQVQSTMSNEYFAPKGPDFLEKLNNIIQHALFFAIIETKNTKEFVGFASMATSNPKNRDCLYSIALLPRFWNRGYGTEVTRFMLAHTFGWLGVHRVSLVVFERNKAAISLYRKIGFIDEGKRRKANWVLGGWEDVLYMGMLDEEWIQIWQAQK
ncbi:acyl-CoA N-acyltransferase [Mycena floridula]|nr:acyl-CoA N-acyltransferase [Mycena floridula]